MTIDVKEHVYDDDPHRGHADVRTRLKDASYFFIGNGHIQAAIQYSPCGEGSPYGLILMDPQKLIAKREALTFDEDSGFEKTMIRIRVVGSSVIKHPKNVAAEWNFESGVPTVRLRWTSSDIEVTEFFYCPDMETPDIIREIHLKNRRDIATSFQMRTGTPHAEIDTEISTEPGQEKTIFIKYTLHDGSVGCELIDRASPIAQTVSFWDTTSALDFHHPLLNHFFETSRFQLQAVMSKNGVVDASIWQYNREWVRDHALMAAGLVLSGHHDLAGVFLRRLLDDFVDDDGCCVDSSEKRDPEDVELDQNGTILCTLKEYVLWTGDLNIVHQNREKIIKTAEYPFQEIFRHEPSGMFCNSRDYWERHKAHGIEPGIELLYQVFPAVGLSCAASLARMVSEEHKASEWEKKAQDLKKTILEHPQYALVNERGFIKRRSIDGSIQETIVPSKNSGLPDGVPLSSNVEHFLDPDTSAALPIALGFVAPDSPISEATMHHLEMLWDPIGDGGGYSRYNTSSEPDSAGAWPFPSLFVARAYAEMGDVEKVWRILRWLEKITGGLSGSWFEFYGNRISPPYPQVGIPPWTWAEMLFLLIHHILGVRPEEDFIRFRPRLLPGMEKIEGSLPFRGHRLQMNLNIDTDIDRPSFKCNVAHKVSDGEGIFIPYTDHDIVIEAKLPKKR
jgi:hypothetical protein